MGSGSVGTSPGGVSVGLTKNLKIGFLRGDQHSPLAESSLWVFNFSLLPPSSPSSPSVLILYLLLFLLFSFLSYPLFYLHSFISSPHSSFTVPGSNWISLPEKEGYLPIISSPDRDRAQKKETAKTKSQRARVWPRHRCSKQVNFLLALFFFPTEGLINHAACRSAPTLSISGLIII